MPDEELNSSGQFRPARSSNDQIPSLPEAASVHYSNFLFHAYSYLRIGTINVLGSTEKASMSYSTQAHWVLVRDPVRTFLHSLINRSVKWPNFVGIVAISLSATRRYTGGLEAGSSRTLTHPSVLCRLLWQNPAHYASQAHRHSMVHRPCLSHHPGSGRFWARLNMYLMKTRPWAVAHLVQISLLEK